MPCRQSNIRAQGEKGDRIGDVGARAEAAEGDAAMGYMSAEDAAGLNSLLASGEGPVGSGVDEMQRAAAEKPYKMTPEKQEWLLARMSDMPMCGLVSPVTTGGASIDKPVDYLACLAT